MIQETSNAFYHFDRIRINSQKYLGLPLDQHLLKEIRRECHSFEIRTPHKQAYDFGNSISLEIVVPSKKALELLRTLHGKLMPYYITYLEITKDTFRESEEQAVSEVKGKRGKLRKRWANSHFIYEPDKKANLEFKKGLYITPTIYCGGNNSKYVLYARPSKLNGKPCFHEEWRLKGPSTIKRATGISIIKNLVSFDIRKFIEERNKRLLRDDLQIDIMKLGKWLTDCTRQKKFSDKKRSDIRFHATAFLTTFEIDSLAALIQYFKKEKKKVTEREKNSRHRKRSDFENKLMKVKNYNRFARVLIDG